jgi:sugar/nucleoside kinase (ribokinase family)
MKDLIAASAIFVTQLELALPTVEHGLKLARSLGVPTILNPAPACKLPESIFQYCDYVTPNETEAEMLTGIKVSTQADAERAADAFLARGVRNAVITLGAQGAFVKNASTRAHVPAFNAGPVVETTGAGDAFNGGFAVALAEGRDILAGSTLRLRRGRHLRHPAGHRALHAPARGSGCPSQIMPLEKFSPEQAGASRIAPRRSVMPKLGPTEIQRSALSCGLNICC